MKYRTKKGRKVTANVNPLALDPSRTLNLRTPFVRELKRRLETYRVVNEFNPAEPRDEQGRWTSGGAGLGEAAAPKKGIFHWGGKAQPIEPVKDAGSLQRRLEGGQKYQAMKQELDKNHEAWYRQLAQKEGMTTEGYKHAVAQEAQKLVNGMDQYVRVPQSIFPKLLESGRFKSVFETGHSQGLVDTKTRSRVEEETMGVPGHIADAFRPISTYMSKGFDHAQDEYANVYGKIMVKLKPEVKQRSTATFGDSLMNGSQRLAVASPLTHIDHRSVDPALLEQGGLKALGHDNYHKAMPFVETQVHGGLGVKDIEEVGFPQQPDPSITKQLEERGIKWRVYGQRTQNMLRFIANLFGAKPTTSRKVFRSQDGQYFIVIVGTMHTPTGDVQLGRLIDLGSETISPEQPVDSIVRHMHGLDFQPFDGDLPVEVEQLLDNDPDGTFNYNPNQPRDEQGRWATTGSAIHSLFDRIHRPDGGFTYQMGTGREPHGGYAVSPYPQRSFAVEADRLKPVDIVRYLKKNKDMLEKEDHYLGAWHDPASHKVFLDVSVVKQSAAEAERLCHEHDQIAYFDLQKFVSVTVNPLATSGGVHNAGQTQTNPHGHEGFDARGNRPDFQETYGPGADRGRNRGSQAGARIAVNAALEYCLDPQVWNTYLGAAYVRGVQRAYQEVTSGRLLAANLGVGAAYYQQGGMEEFTRNVVSRYGLASVKVGYEGYAGLLRATSGRLDPSLLPSYVVSAARSAVVDAHAEGQLDALETLGVHKVRLVADPTCKAHKGTVLNVKDAHGQLPRHRDCLCAWAPVPNSPRRPPLEAFSDLLANYSPDQPRDEKGRWTDEGGGVAVIKSPGATGGKVGDLRQEFKDLGRFDRSHGPSTVDREEWDKMASHLPPGEKASEWTSKVHETHPPTRADDPHTTAPPLGTDEHGEPLKPPGLENAPVNPGSEHLMAPVVEKKALDDGANRSSIVTLENGEKGVWKPASGEYPDLRPSIAGGTYYRREGAAYAVAKILGLDDLVPPTTVREIGGNVGSIQEFIPRAKNARHFDAAQKYDGREDCTRAAAFDYVTGNTDRHDNNWMVGEDGKLILIDNGLTFPNRHGGYANYDLFDEMRVPVHRFGGVKTYEDMVKVPGYAKEWQAKWPAIKGVLLSHGIEPKAIELTKSRLDELASKVGQEFADLKQAFGQYAEE